jgi:hypothetical protein
MRGNFSFWARAEADVKYYDAYAEEFGGAESGGDPDKTAAIRRCPARRGVSIRHGRSGTTIQRVIQVWQESPLELSAELKRQDAKNAKNWTEPAFNLAFSKLVADGWSRFFYLAFLASLAVRFGR